LVLPFLQLSDDDGFGKAFGIASTAWRREA